MGNKVIRLAVAGGRRGRAFNQALDSLKDKVVLKYICDKDNDVISEWTKSFPDITGVESFAELIEKADFDAVFIATPIEFHFEQSVAALKAGKHVLCEVFAASELEQLEMLVETVEDTGLVYMMAENYVYTRQNMMVLDMTQKGVFGDITYAEGMYIHDCRRLRLDNEGNVTWRGEMLKNVRGNTYPTHSLGPVAKWMGLTDRDFMKRSSTFISRQAAMNDYVRKHFGSDHPSLQKGFWAYGDSVITVIECDSGALIVLRFDGDSNRPHNTSHYHLQGVNASFMSGRHTNEDPIVWIDGSSSKNQYGEAEKWDSLWKYEMLYEHPLWVEHMDQASGFGHGGSDFFVLRDFVDAILSHSRPFIDVYDAASWSSIVPISIESVKKGGAPIDIPRFLRKPVKLPIEMK